MSIAIRVSNLTKKFARSTGYLDLLPEFVRKKRWITAIKDCNLEIKDGELFGLLGPNGAGKTTLIKMICTLILPTSGTASCYGHDVVREEQGVKELVGLVSADERSFYWRLTAYQNLEFYASLYRVPASSRRQRIADLLDLVGLTKEADRRFQTYSTGMRQRLAIARGLLNDPKILFVDEPTKGVDPISAMNVRQFLRSKVAGPGRTVILATNHLAEAQQLCDRVAIMNHGRIAAVGSVPELRTIFQRQDKCQMTVRHAADGLLETIKQVPGVAWCNQPGHHNGTVNWELFLSDRVKALPEVIKLVVTSGGDICDCNINKSSLEEIFVTALDRTDLEESEGD